MTTKTPEVLNPLERVRKYVATRAVIRRDELESILNASDGWVCVPVEPTGAQLMAGRKQLFADMAGAHMGPSAENTYKAMIAASQEKGHE